MAKECSHGAPARGPKRRASNRLLSSPSHVVAKECSHGAQARGPPRQPVDRRAPRQTPPLLPKPRSGGRSARTRLPASNVARASSPRWPIAGVERSRQGLNPPAASRPARTAPAIRTHATASFVAVPHSGQRSGVARRSSLQRGQRFSRRRRRRRRHAQAQAAGTIAVAAVSARIGVVTE